MKTGGSQLKNKKGSSCCFVFNPEMYIEAVKLLTMGICGKLNSLKFNNIFQNGGREGTTTTPQTLEVPESVFG